MEEAGIAAVVMYSLFEEQIIHESLELDHFLNRGTESFAEALTYFPDIGKYSLAPEKYLETLEKTKQAVNIPVMGSLNGVSTGGWIEYARKIQDAGAMDWSSTCITCPPISTSPAASWRIITSSW